MDATTLPRRRIDRGLLPCAARPTGCIRSSPPTRTAGPSASTAATATASTTIVAEAGIGVEPGARECASDRRAADSSAARSRPCTRCASPRAADAKTPFPIVSERERTGPPMTADRDADLELLLRRVIREEAGITAGGARGEMARRHAGAAPGHAGPAGEELADRDVLSQDRDAAETACGRSSSRSTAPTCLTT